MSARILALAFAAMVVVACGGRSTAPQTETDSGPPADATSGDDPDAGLPPGVAYQSGGVNCCEKGIGRTCCVSGRRCGEYGGSGECTVAGGGISSKALCTICCDGLTAIAAIQVVDGACDFKHVFPDEAICAACGDGVCDAARGENFCNCPKDCH